MKKIKRAPFKMYEEYDELMSGYQEYLGYAIEDIKEGHYKALLTCSEYPREMTAYRVAFGNNDGIKEYFKLALRADLLYIRVCESSGKMVDVNIDDTGDVKVKADEGDCFTEGNWMSAWTMAMILRDKEAIKGLYNTDISCVKPVNDKDHVRIGYLHFKLFYSLGLDEKPDMNLFNEMEAIVLKNMNSYYMPDVAEFPYPNYFFNFNRALILKAIIDNNQEAFTKHLFEGVTYHKEFWGQKVGLNRGDTPLCDDPDGFISWHLTALAAMAYDRGLNIEVDSDYITLWLVE
ncbi:MAG: immunity 49 family protein [Bacteroidales bacterium]|jgi:hypothetical protein|nr:immunity 49 family protein [Bacteroidales bacterium]